MRSRARREVLSSGADSGPGSPKVRPAPRGTYALVGPPLGRSETFWGPAEECGSAAWPAMIRRAAAGGRGLQLPSCSGGADAYKSRRTPQHRGSDYDSWFAPCVSHWRRGATGPGLSLAVAADSCVHRLSMWHLESSVVPVRLLRT